MKERNLRTKLTISTFLFAVGCADIRMADFDTAFSVENDNKIIAFVGRKIGIREFDPSRDDPDPADPDEIIIHMDSAFEARYEILELIHGKYDRRLIDFEAYDHYGVPSFSKPDVAMIFLVEENGRLYHYKYQWAPVHKTKDGRYAYCGDPYFDFDDDDRINVKRQPLQNIAFDPPVSIRVADSLIPKWEWKEYSEEEIRKNRSNVAEYYSPPVFEVRQGHAICKMGVYAPEIYRIENERVFLPRQRREACEIETNYNNSDWKNLEKSSALKACIQKKRAADISN